MNNQKNTYQKNKTGTGRQPDYNVSALDKKTGTKGRVGAAWKNADGSISISINSFVLLDGGPDLVLTLFVNDRKEK